MGRKIWSIGVGVALVLAACGTEIPQSSPVSFTDTTTPAEVSVTSGITDTSGQTTTTVAPRSDSPLFVECSGIDLGQFPFEPERLLPYDGDVAALVDDDAADEFGPMFGTGTEWFVGSDTEEELSLLTPAEPDELGRLRYGHAVFERRADGLQLTGFGSGCVVEATLEGYGIAELSLPLGIVQHVPDATLFSILATERSCAGGQSPQEVLTFVTETTDRVEIVVLVESPPGFQDCPSNPAFELRIEIDEAARNPHTDRCRVRSRRHAHWPRWRHRHRHDSRRPAGH